MFILVNLDACEGVPSSHISDDRLKTLEDILDWFKKRENEVKSNDSLNQKEPFLISHQTRADICSFTHHWVQRTLHRQITLLNCILSTPKPTMEITPTPISLLSPHFMPCFALFVWVFFLHVTYARSSPKTVQCSLSTSFRLKEIPGINLL